MRALIFLTVIGLANYYVSARLFAYAPIPKVHFLIPVICAMALFGLEMLDLRTTFFQTYPSIKLLISATTGAFFCLLFYTFVADIILLISHFFPDYTARVKNGLFYAIIGLTLASTIIGVIQAKAGPSLKEVIVKIKDLPAAFENYRIVQISDLHVGGTIRKPYVENVLNIVNQTDADLIALTGDFADGTVEELKNDSAILAGMKSKDGIYFITGNHEYYHDVANWLPYYSELGFHVLSNSHDVITRDGAKMVIAGTTDYSISDRKNPGHDVGLASADMPQDAVKIILMHQPNLYKEAAKAGFDLQLSGHTHGGQFFPWTLVVPFFHDYFKGLNRFENLQIYISVGTGYWGPALRTFVPTEVTLLTLKRA